MGDIIKSQYSLDRIKKEWVWVGRDLVSLAQTLPRQLKWMFKKFQQRRLRLLKSRFQK
ncbi:MAG: hypothetical protein KA715_01615 [Xanthomonadaceae bacterium]|nr:hypothetical protein [Xanthomonadaceae bacterium]